MSHKDIESSILNYLNPYQPKRIGIFGSFARNEESPDSDIDLLVRFQAVPFYCCT
ncbi:MAG: nucleotidyltransferase domain-containing protein [Bacteroidales bacterium]|nr:nucleotidyltransferase domain-containing protein [Bacteroidales bacterium]MCF8458530.1 nucleotidyltransferase domain-containing protein [Bacteroidales bacterium]